MDVKKLDRWAELLLDTGKRNNLINFKDGKTSTAEVLFPYPDSLLEKINESNSFEVFDTKNMYEDDEFLDSSGLEMSQEFWEESDELKEKEAFKAKYIGKIKKKNQILLYNKSSNPLVAIKKIDKKSREFMDETGINVSYFVFGFIHWKESDSSKYFSCAPILLVPIQLKQTSAIDPYIIKSVEDDIIVNPTFSYKMEIEYGVKLPEYNGERFQEYLDIVRRIVTKLQWSVSSECKIGVFSFQKINMYRDLKDNAKLILENDIVRRILGETNPTGNFNDICKRKLQNPRKRNKYT